ncbi:MAG: hypothetical protein AABY69_05550 [Nitrospirota bacterium]
MSQSASPHVFTCPRCRETYWGGAGEQLPDCPHCGHDYRTREGVRIDLLFLMVLIVAMVGFLLLTSTYRSGVVGSSATQAVQGDIPEKLPGR